MTVLTTNEVLQMLADCFAEPVEEIIPGRARDDIAGWDSMGALMLMAELDERCNLQLSAEQSKRLRSVADVLDYLRAEQQLLEHGP